mmetsp:Transcript_33638/g.81325  ORF Transcript_33638/g.81325 Transcript_33638/m.81325 type:complete len:269 (-) Transcript_33638:208-1014(-)
MLPRATITSKSGYLLFVGCLLTQAVALGPFCCAAFTAGPLFPVSPSMRTSTIDDNNHYKRIKMSAAAATAARAVGKLSPSNTALLVCDVQERFRPLIHKMETVVNTTKFMTSVAKELDFPIVATQQYTKVFGPTIADAFADPKDLGASVPVFEKKKFSMMTEDFSRHLTTLDKKSYLLVGIEAHVCLQQTALDLLELGHDVHIIADGVSSQQPYDREMALRRMESCGAWLTTAQSAAFMLMGSADHTNFKAVSKLVKNHMALENEFNE